MPYPRESLEIFRDKGLLIARGRLGWQSQEHFGAACEQLLSGERDELVVDLTESMGISSANMSLLVNMHYRAGDRGKKLKLRVSPDIAQVFDRTRLKDLVGMDIQKVEPDAKD